VGGMEPAELEDRGISPWVRTALVADLAMADLGKEGDYWLQKRVREKWECAEHFGRQLQVPVDEADEAAHLEETLVFLLRRVDEQIRQWPPPNDHALWLATVDLAVRNLTDVEAYATLLAGPGRWRRGQPSSGWDQLGGESRSRVSKGLTAELQRVLANWIEWDVPSLAKRRGELIKQRQAAGAALAGASVVGRVPYYKRNPPGERDAPLPSFTPPPR
jgi:hypothetical protein